MESKPQSQAVFEAVTPPNRLDSLNECSSLSPKSKDGGKEATTPEKNGQTVKSLIEKRKMNAEDLLVALGFGDNSYCNPLLRIPNRFLKEQSYAKGVCVADIIQRRNSVLLRESVSQSFNFFLPELLSVENTNCDETHSQCFRKVPVPETLPKKPKILVIGPARFECINTSTIKALEETETTDEIKEHNPFDEQFRTALKSVDKGSSRRANKHVRYLSCPNMKYVSISNENDKVFVETHDTVKIKLQNLSKINQFEETIENELLFNNQEISASIQPTDGVENLFEPCLVVAMNCAKLSCTFCRSVTANMENEVDKSADAFDEDSLTVNLDSMNTTLHKLKSDIFEVEHILTESINETERNVKLVNNSYKILNFSNEKIPEILLIMEKINGQFLEENNK